MNVLLFNFSLYLFYTLWGFKKCPYLTVHNLISTWFSFISLMGVVTVYYGYYQAVFGELKVLELEPYLWCFLCFLFLMLPLRKLNYKNIQILEITSLSTNRFIKFTYFPFIVLLVYTIVYIPDVILALSMQDIADVYKNQRVGGEDLYNRGAFAQAIIWIGRKFYNWFWAILAFYSLYHLNKTKEKNKYFLFLLIVAVAPYFLRTISTGGRGGFVFFSIQIVAVLLPLYYYLRPAFKKKIFLSIVIFLSVGWMYVISMTVARSQNSTYETPFTSILRYFGEPYPNLGNNIWGHVNNHLMGRRMFPELFGFSNSGNTQYENFGAWQSYSGIATLNYKTIFGDFYLEFGTLIAVSVIALIGLLMNFYLRKGKLYFHQIPLYAYYVTICSTAPLWFGQRNTGDLFVVVQLLFFGFVIKKVFLPKV